MSLFTEKPSVHVRVLELSCDEMQPAQATDYLIITVAAKLSQNTTRPAAKV